MNLAYGLILIAFSVIITALCTRAYTQSKLKPLGSIIVVDDPEDGQTYMAADVYSKAALDALKNGDIVQFDVKR